MKVDIGQDRRDDRALRRALLAFPPTPILHDPRLQELCGAPVSLVHRSQPQFTPLAYSLRCASTVLHYTVTLRQRTE